MQEPVEEFLKETGEKFLKVIFRLISNCNNKETLDEKKRKFKNLPERISRVIFEFYRRIALWVPRKITSLRNKSFKNYGGNICEICIGIAQWTPEEVFELLIEGHFKQTPEFNSQEISQYII